jgi:hypothetical protein
MSNKELANHIYRDTSLIRQHSIHTFGDSHSSTVFSGWKDCDNIKPHHLGPILCYSFGREILNRCNIGNFDIKDNDSVVFCFGEIDCRGHIHKHITPVKSYKMIIDEIVNNYIHAIKINLENCKVKLKNICIYNIVPPTRKNVSVISDPLRYLGSDEERKKYTLYFNMCLKKQCEENNWIFFDVYDFYCNSEGYLNTKYSDSIHIIDGIFIKKFIIDNL